MAPLFRFLAIEDLQMQEDVLWMEKVLLTAVLQDIFNSHSLAITAIDTKMKGATKVPQFCAPPDNAIDKGHLYGLWLQAAQKLVEDGATKIYAILTHGIFRYYPLSFKCT